MIAEQLQEAIRDCGKSRYRLSQETGIDQSVLCRFLQGKSSLTLSSVDKVLNTLGLEVVIKPRNTRKGE
jgi:DNA-binding phage protein